MDLKILLLNCLVLALFSCSIDENEKIVYKGEELILKKEFYADGSIEGRHTLKKVFPDSLVNHGFVEYFYPSGSLKYRAELDNGNKIGNVKKYFESGQVMEVWFYNPIGQALYSVHFTEEGQIFKELAPEQRAPQVIYKDGRNDSIELKIYSADIPTRKKNIYLINDSNEILDSAINSKEAYNKMVIHSKLKYYQINVDYCDINTGAFSETDSFQFSLEE